VSLLRNATTWQSDLTHDRDGNPIMWSCTKCMERYYMDELGILIKNGILWLACQPCRVVLNLEG
jgi:hypothetical protein